MWARVGSQLIARVSGPMKFRLVLQPVMSAFFAVRDGLKAAKAGRLPYFADLIMDTGHRKTDIKEGWKSVGRVFILALIMDVIYQVIVLRFVYVGEAIIVSFILAILPYLILCGLVNRVARRRNRGAHTINKEPPMSNAA
jgi:hypothetical protein